MPDDSYRQWKGWSTEAFGTFSRGESLYFAAEIARSGVPSLAGKRVLEIGFGNGPFAGWATQRGAVYKGVELIPELVTLGRERGFDVHQCDLSTGSVIEDGTVDIVVAFDVFEHLDLPALKETLRRVRDALAVGGLLIARVPSGDSPFARSTQHGDLTHRSTLGSSAVRHLAADTGFLVKQTRGPAFPSLGYGALSFLRRSAVKLARALTFPIIIRLFMGGAPCVLAPEMVFVLVKPR